VKLRSNNYSVSFGLGSKKGSVVITISVTHLVHKREWGVRYRRKKSYAILDRDFLLFLKGKGQRVPTCPPRFRKEKGMSTGRKKIPRLRIGKRGGFTLILLKAHQTQPISE